MPKTLTNYEVDRGKNEISSRALKRKNKKRSGMNKQGQEKPGKKIRPNTLENQSTSKKKKKAQTHQMTKNRKQQECSFTK